MSILYVTSMNKKIYELSGIRLLSSFLETNMKNDLLITYEEDNEFLEKLDSRNIMTFNMTNYDYLNNWLKENEDIIPEKYGGLYNRNTCTNKILNLFMKDEFNEKCSLWFRKIASLNYALNNYNKYDYIVWVDADCIFTKNIQSNVLIQQFYGTNCFFHLGRKRHKMCGAIESGFIGFKKSKGYKLLNNIINEYSNKQFLKYKRWDDGFIMARIILNSNIKSIDLMPTNIYHLEPLLFSFFKDYIYHYKGSHHYEYKKNLNIKNYIEYENKIFNKLKDLKDYPNINDFKVLFITSSTKKMYDKQGKVFLDSFFKYQNDDLLYLTENFKLDINKENLIESDILNHKFLIDWLEKFKYLIPKELNGEYDIQSNKYNFMTPKTTYNVENNLFKGDWNFKASLWFRKIASLHYAYERFKDKYDIFIWIDIDSLINKKINKVYINKLFNNKDFFYNHKNGREKKDYGIEAGFMGCRKYEMLLDIFKCYTCGDFEKFNRWDDGYIIKQIIFAEKYKNSINNISDNYNIEDYIIHLKGIHWRNKIDYERD